MTARLRVGVLLTSTDVRAWQRLILQRIKSVGCAELAVVIMDTTPGHAEAHFRAIDQSGWNISVQHLPQQPFALIIAVFP